MESLIFPGDATSPTPFGLSGAGLWDEVEVSGEGRCTLVFELSGGTHICSLIPDTHTQDRDSGHQKTVPATSFELRLGRGNLCPRPNRRVSRD